MSENVIIILITTLGPIILALIGLRSIRLQKDNNKITKEAMEKVDDNTKITNEVKETVGIVKTQTDGVKDEIIKTTRLLGEAVGKAAGKAEQKIETEADNAKATTDAVMKVEVVNEPLQVIPPKETK